MSTTTPNLELLKPADSEFIDIDIINNNYDILDAAAKLKIINSSENAVSISQLNFLDNTESIWKNLDEVRLYNNIDTLICKEGVTTGLLFQDNQIKIVSVFWNRGIPAVGTTKGYISSDGNYHIYDESNSQDITSLTMLRDSISNNTSNLSSLQTSVNSNTSNISSLQTSVNGKAAKGDSIKNITRSGTTFTATKADGTTFTFTQQDNNDNTTYSASTSYGITMSGTEIRRYSNVLYNNTSGSNGTITLSSSAANYNHMRIYYYVAQQPYMSTDVYSPNGKTVSLLGASMATSEIAQLSFAKITISGTSITKNNYGYINVATNKQCVAGTANDVYITRVEAWNE